MQVADKNSEYKQITTLSTENTSGRGTTSLSYEADWLREICDCCGPIREHCEGKSMRSMITFDTQLKIALTSSHAKVPGNKL